MTRLDSSALRRVERPTVTTRLDFAQVFAEHAVFIRRAVIHLAGPHLDADDLVQDVLMEVFRKLPAFRGECSLRSWLYGITLGVVSNARRRAHFRRFLGLEAVPEAISADSSAAGAERREAVHRLHALLDRLSEKKRTVFVLFELDELSIQEIAEVLRCPPATVKTRLHHARLELMRQIRIEEQREHERAHLKRTTR